MNGFFTFMGWLAVAGIAVWVGYGAYLLAVRVQNWWYAQRK